jgi:hypothetical protein
MITEHALQVQLEEWAIWVQSGTPTAKLGYSQYAAGFSGRAPGGQGDTVLMSRQEEVERAVMQLQIQDHGVYDTTRRQWVQRPEKRYSQCAEVLRAHYRAHPAYGHAAYEEPGNATPKTLHRLGIGQKTYYRKLGLAMAFVRELL